MFLFAGNGNYSNVSLRASTGNWDDKIDLYSCHSVLQDTNKAYFAKSELINKYISFLIHCWFAQSSLHLVIISLIQTYRQDAINTSRCEELLEQTIYLGTRDNCRFSFWYIFINLRTQVPFFSMWTMEQWRNIYRICFSICDDGNWTTRAKENDNKEMVYIFLSWRNFHCARFAWE